MVVGPGGGGGGGRPPPHGVVLGSPPPDGGHAAAVATTRPFRVRARVDGCGGERRWRVAGQPGWPPPRRPLAGGLTRLCCGRGLCGVGGGRGAVRSPRALPRRYGGPHWTHREAVVPATRPHRQVVGAGSTAIVDRSVWRRRAAVVAGVAHVVAGVAHAAAVSGGGALVVSRRRCNRRRLASRGPGHARRRWHRAGRRFGGSDGCGAAPSLAFLFC